MSDIAERAKAAHARRWEQPGGVYPQSAPSAVVELGDWASEYLPELVAEVERLRFDQDWFTKRLQDELDPGGGDEWDADDVVQIVRDLEAENERLRNVIMDAAISQHREALKGMSDD